MPVIKIMLICSACSSAKNDKNEGAGASALMRLLPQVPKSERIVNAVIPANLAKAATSLALTSSRCYGAEYAGVENLLSQRACLLEESLIRLVNPENEFGLKGLSAKADERIVETFERAGAGYIICLDKDHQGGLSYTHNDTTMKTPAYQEKILNGQFSFPDGGGIDLDFTYTLSCYESHEDVLATMLGRNDGTYYSKNSQLAGSGSLSIVDQKDNIELWWTLGDYITAPPEGKETFFYEDGEETYPGTTALLNYQAKPANQTMEMAMLTNQDCGWRVISNDEALFFQGNLNNIGFCSANDTHVGGDYGNHTEDFYPALAEVTFCFKIDGEGLGRLESTQLCDDNGLNIDAFTVPWIQRSSLKAYNVAHILDGFENPGINEFLVVPAEQLLGTDELLGAEENVVRLMMGRPDDAKQAASISVACSDAANQSETIKAVFAYPLSQVFDELYANAEPEQISDIPTEDQLFQMLNKGIQEQPDRFRVLVSGGRTRGVNYRGGFEVTATISIDGVELGSVALSSPDDPDQALAEDVIVIEPTQIQNGGVFQVVYSGELKLLCETSNEVERRARFIGGIPRLQIPSAGI